MILIVDADSIMSRAENLLLSNRAAQLCLLRLVFMLRAKHNPEQITVFASGVVPFTGTSPSCNIVDALSQTSYALKDVILLSCDSHLLALSKFGATAFRPDPFFLNPVAVTHTRLRTELGYDPLDIPVLPDAPTKADKSKAGKDRKVRYAWAEAPTGHGTFKAIVNNVHVVVGRGGFENYEIVQDIPTLLNLLDKVDTVGWDTETTSLDWMENLIVGESFSIDGQRGYYLPIAHTVPSTEYQNIPYEQVSAEIHPVLATKRIRGANLAFDVLSLASKGTPFFKNLEDIQGYAYMLGYHVPDPSQIGLKPLTRAVTGSYMEEYAAVASGKANFSQVPIERAAPYAADDAVKSWLVADQLRGRLSPAQQWRYDNIEMPFLNTVIRMQYNGMFVDTDVLGGIADEFAARMESLRMEMWAHAGHEFNVQSGAQIAKVFFDELNITRTKRTKTGWSTTTDDLERIQAEHHIILDYLEYKELQKIATTYLTYPRFIRRTGRIHSNIKPFFVITGRLSSTEPNLLNIPTRTEIGKRVRAAFIAQHDQSLLSVDAGQLEYRLLAHVTKNQLLIDAFNDPSRDPHKEIASLVFEVPVDEVTKDQRGAAKTTVYAIIYGAWIQKIATTLGVSISEAKRIYDAIYVAIPELAPTRARVIAEARQLGYVESLAGHRSYIGGLNSAASGLREAAERSAFDSLFQGTASGDITKIACIKTQELLDNMWPDVLNPLVKFNLQIHDEILLEGPAQILEELGPQVGYLFETALELSVPIVTEYKVGKTWAEIH